MKKYLNLKKYKFINIKNIKSIKNIKVLFVFLAFLIIENTVYAAFNNKILNNININIAMPILEVIEGNVLNLNNDNLGGVYEFEIRNYNSLNQINQVRLLYRLNILIDTTNINEYRLIKVVEENEIQQQLNSNSIEGILECNERQTIKYKLYVSYLDSTASISDDIKIIINSEQVGE